MEKHNHPNEWVEKTVIPTFASTEHAAEWGLHLNAEQHATLLEVQRALSYGALAETNLQLKVNLATQSQLLREAAESFARTGPPSPPIRKGWILGR